jgi:hypothetical protein
VFEVILLKILLPNTYKELFIEVLPLNKILFELFNNELIDIPF